MRSKMTQQVYLRFQPVGHHCNCQSSNDEVACPMCFATGKNFERERIIKLLEVEMEPSLGENGKCIYAKHYRDVCNCEIIALIEGENK